MFVRSQLIGEIFNYLSWMQGCVHMQNSNGLFDINKYCEDVVCGLLNLTYDVNLVNLNNEKYNFPAVDLGDCQKRISFQVTSTNEIEKIKYTVNKFIEKELHERFDGVNIFILGCKKNYRAKVDAKGKIKFDINKNIIDMNDLSKVICNLDNDRIIKIYNYLKSTINLNSERTSYDEDLYGEFTSTIREYIKILRTHDFSISPTSIKFVDNMTKIINEWQLADRTFNFQKLENYKQEILDSLSDLTNYLSSPIYFQAHTLDGFIMPIKDYDRKNYNEMSEKTYELRNKIVTSYQEMCKTYNSLI